ncbi:hypothetical protein CPT_Murica147 [Escherichia phage Murica]|nr:hypothetical protein FDG88_gp132 [Escherichia phage Murica]AKU44239.1 hypothetical protein CPT_Murica147 [Escherichia phage Murica]
MRTLSEVLVVILMIITSIAAVAGILTGGT